MTDPHFGDGYPHSNPQTLRVIAALNPDGELVDVTNQLDAWADRETFQFTRANENGSSASLSFDLVLPQGSGPDVMANRYVAVDDPTRVGPNGGSLGLFAGYTMSPSAVQQAVERVITIRCVDFGVLLTRPPKQIVTQWPPGDGTPVVYATVEVPLVPGSGVTFTPASIRDLYVGKRVFAQNADGTNKERVTITAVDAVAGTVTADFLTAKTSWTATVHTALHATGVQEITPDDMSDVTEGAIVWCQKHHGDQTVGNEYVVITSVTDSTFTAEFQFFKDHDWTIQGRWYISGGISDREFIADGWKQSVDVLDDSGNVVTSIVDVPSLLDYFFISEGVAVSKDGVDEVVLSLPHGKFEGQSPLDALNWCAAQSSDPTVEVAFYMSFVQPASLFLSILTPMLRWYDKGAGLPVATLALVSHEGPLGDNEARYTGYTYPEDGTNFANHQDVTGSNFSAGSWQDDDSVSNPLANNYVGRVIAAPVIKDTTLTTNAQCDQRATEFAALQGLSTRKKSVQVTTWAELDPLVLYQPEVVSFSNTFEPGISGPLAVDQVSLSFSNQGIAQWTFTLGKRRKVKPELFDYAGTVHRATVVTNGRGGAASVRPPVTRYVNDHHVIDNPADLYVADTSNGPLTVYLPPASQYPGLPLAFHVRKSAGNPLTVVPYQRGSTRDTVDGSDTVVIKAGQTLALQSTGEHDVQGTGGQWHPTAAADANGLTNPYDVETNTVHFTNAVGTDQILVRYDPDGLLPLILGTTRLRLGQTGDEYGDTYLDLLNRTGANGVALTTTGPALIDFILAHSGGGSNLRLEGRGEFTFLGAVNEWQFGPPGDPDVVVGANGLAARHGFVLQRLLNDSTPPAATVPTDQRAVRVNPDSGSWEYWDAGASAWTPFGGTGGASRFYAVFAIGNGVDVLEEGNFFDVPIPRACTVVKYKLEGDVAGTVSLDVLRLNDADWAADDDFSASIAGSDHPSLVGTRREAGVALTGWTTALAEDDVLRAVVEGTPDSVTRVILSLALEG